MPNNRCTKTIRRQRTSCSLWLHLPRQDKSTGKADRHISEHRLRRYIHVDRLRLSTSFPSSYIFFYVVWHDAAVIKNDWATQVQIHACISCAYDLESTPTYGLVRVGGRAYEIKTLRSNLAPEEGWGRLFEGSIIIISKYGTCTCMITGVLYTFNST